MKFKEYPRKDYRDADARELTRAVKRKEAQKDYVDLYDQQRDIERANLQRIDNPYSKVYKGMDPLRRKDMSFGGMIREDNTAMSNMPRQAIHCQYADQGTFSNIFMQDERYNKD